MSRDEGGEGCQRGLNLTVQRGLECLLVLLWVGERRRLSCNAVPPAPQLKEVEMGIGTRYWRRWVGQGSSNDQAKVYVRSHGIGIREGIGDRIVELRRNGCGLILGCALICPVVLRKERDPGRRGEREGSVLKRRLQGLEEHVERCCAVVHSLIESWAECWMLGSWVVVSIGYWTYTW